MSNTVLDILRQRLNTIDNQLVQLLDERFRITDEVAVYKNQYNIPIEDKQREHEIIQRMKSLARHKGTSECVEAIYTIVASTNKKLYHELYAGK